MRRLAMLLPLAALAAVPAAGSIHDRIYPAPTAPLAAVAGTALIRVATADGLSLAGLEAAGAPGRPVLLFFHGNGSSAADAARWMAPLLGEGWGLLAAEYRGYSGNPGRADEAGLARDADAFLARARALAAGRPVIVVGHSLGGGVAFGLATRARLDALVTIGTFTRLRAMAPRIARAFIGDRYDNLAAVPTLDEPLFLVHGTADDTVPPQELVALARAARAAHRPGAVYVIDGADHHPAPATVAGVLRAVAARLAGTPPPALPAGVRAYDLAVDPGG